MPRQTIAVTLPLPRGIADDPLMLGALTERLHADLDEQVRRVGGTPVGDVTVMLSDDVLGWPLPRTWLQRLLRRPVRHVKGPLGLRAEVRCDV